MTTNQIEYWKLKETERSNAAKEAETARDNRARLAETTRSNVATETIKAKNLSETQRSNLAKEADARKQTTIKEGQLKLNTDQQQIDSAQAGIENLQRAKEHSDKMALEYTKAGLNTVSNIAGSLIKSGASAAKGGK